VSSSGYEKKPASYWVNLIFRGMLRAVAAFLDEVLTGEPFYRPRLGDRVMGAAVVVHPSEQTLHAYGLGKLDDVLSESVNQHLESCPDCQRRVAELSSDSFLGRIQRAQGPSRDVSSPAGGPADSDQPPPAETMPPGLADHPEYEVIRELGRGGMGVVYLAHHRLLAINVVLKVMARQLMDRPGVLDRFLSEMRAVAALQHPNIVSAYSAFRLGESILFAMEYVDGLDLAKLVKAKGPLPVAHACYYVSQAAQGMQYAHEQGIVHRDIKPGNLMLQRRGNRALVKILDFGLAKATRGVPEDGGLTNPGQALGTPDYMAPEQIRDAQKADIRADIYSLGCTLYYLLSGRPPFQAENLWDLYQAHHSMEAKLLNLVRPEVPAELASLVAKMMAKDPERRFQTPAEVLQALTPFFKSGRATARITNADLSRIEPSEGAARGSAPTQPATSVASGSASPAKEPAEKDHNEPRWERLIDLRDKDPLFDAMLDANPPLPSTPAQSQRDRRVFWPLIAAVAGLMLLGLFVAGFVVFKVKTANGTLVLESVPENAVVEIDGYRITVTPKDGEPLHIEAKAGTHGVIVKRGDLVLLGDSVKLEAGKQSKLIVRLESPAALEQRKTSPLTAEPLPGNGMTDTTRNEPINSPATAGPGSDGQETVTNSVGMKLKRIPAGEFLMGTPYDDKGTDANEKPQHRVRISKSFYLGVYEVTQGQYRAVTANNPSYFLSTGGGKELVAGQSTSQHPVECVSWLDAVAFCNKLGEMEGRRPFYQIDEGVVRVPDWNGAGYRLPTEAEWEYACRANESTPRRYSFGDGAAELGEFGWFEGNSDDRTHPVRQKRPNAFGLYDMHGNVWEWCWDSWGEDYYDQSPATDPTGPEWTSHRVIRGGGWNTSAPRCRSAYRGNMDMDNRITVQGFRVTLGRRSLE
jgi:serine/threonine protein kinase/formylglycine-generating enzyme required for sulfatase activity